MRKANAAPQGRLSTTPDDGLRTSLEATGSTNDTIRSDFVRNTTAASRKDA